MSPRLAFLRTGAAALVVALRLSASAAAISDDFNDGDDDGWTRFSPLQDYGAGGTFTFPNGAYRIDAPVSPDAQSLGPARAGSFRLDGTFPDFDLEVNLPALSLTPIHTDLGLFARATNLGPGTTDGYTLTYNPSGTLSLLRITNEVDSEIEVIPLTLDTGKSYRLRFVGVGSSLTGTVFDLAAPATPVATVFGTDATYGNGNVGLFVYDDSVDGNQNAVGIFDNFSVAVPEPTAATYTVLGVLLAWGTRRSRQKAEDTTEKRKQAARGPLHPMPRWR